ncbi:MAG: nitrate oxidoreductase subunit beta [Chloroflexota bacterium]|nr:nitrate oxidoreductase subunit beta [Chloroflexota bacterium]
MPKVPNWQLGREMDYPYERGKPQRQFAAVFNINRCIGCQTCTMACKSAWTFSEGQEFMWWNNVESKPYGGYPQFWDVKLLALLDEANPDGQVWDTSAKDAQNAPYGRYDGLTIFEAAKKAGARQQALGYLPSDKEWRAPNIYEDTSVSWSQGSSLPEHSTWFFYLQRICNHCSYPACLAACPRKAIYKRAEDGIVLIDQKRCRGYKKCVEQCPYKKPMFRSATRVSEKCIACYPRVEGKDALVDNEPMVTRCISACVGKIRLQGWIDDEKSPVYYLVRKEKVALPLYPQFGTEPNVYYIPPRWVPRPYLEQMFGPGVEDAIDRYSNPSEELLGVLQLFGSTQRLIFSYEITDEAAIGFDEKGREIVRVPIEEPVIVRPPQHLNIT